MNFELYIENLGAIEKAEMTINPLTILAGENGTGKSFVTKFLYSVLNVLMKDVYKIELHRSIHNSLHYFKDIKEFWEDGNNTHFLELFSFLNSFSLEKYNDNYIKKFDKLLLKYNEEVDLFLKNLEKSIIEQDSQDNSLDSSRPKHIFLFGLSIKHGHISTLFSMNKAVLEYISLLLKNPENEFLEIMNDHLAIEIKANFQISQLKQLIKKDKNKLIFVIKDIIRIEIQDNQINITQYDYLKNNIVSINRLVFFESPIYWRLSRDLIKNSNKPQTYYLSNEINDERLTGIPKFFLDLRELVFTNFKNGELPDFIQECSKKLELNLNGKFNTDSDDLSFETNQGQPIVKNLVSFGMTNLGIIQAVLSKNIINKGSFVFIDEPESNLHPEWQAVLADILVKLAENGVFVVITTHSSDMLKALEVSSQTKEQQTFVATHYFEKNGTLTLFEQHEIENVGTLALARNKLLEQYALLTFTQQGGFFDD